MRIFRDESSLSANPHLWSSITDALDQSSWFVLLLSPEAAESPWVNDEVEYWLEHKDPDRIIPVLTDGEFGWEGDVTGNSYPPALVGALVDEPRWVDLRFARTEESLDLRNPAFSAAVADVASAMHGVPKDELASEEVRQHRRTKRTAWAAAAGLLILGLLAGVAAVFALGQQNEAQEQRAVAEAAAAAEAEARIEADANAAEADTQRIAAQSAEALAASRELAASAIAVVDDDPELATLLALEAIAAAPEGVEQPLEVINALWRAGSADRLVAVFEIEAESLIDLSADGTLLVATTAENEVSRLDPITGEALWSYSEETIDRFAHPFIGPDGRVAQTIIDSTAAAAVEFQEDDDLLPNRIAILGGETAELLHTLEFPDCAGVDTAAWSLDGAYLAVGSGQRGCMRNETLHWLEVFETGAWEPVAFLPIESFAAGPVPRFDASGRLYALVSFGPAVVFEAETFESPSVSEATGIGDVSPDGSRLVLFYSDEEGGTDFSARTFDGESGEVIDILYNGISYPAAPYGVRISTDGETAFVGTGGATTSVYALSAGTELFQLPTGPVNTLAHDALAELLYTAGADGDIRVWDLSASAVGVEPTGDLGNFTWVNGNSFATGPESGAFEVIDLAAGLFELRFFDTATGVLQPGSIPDAFSAQALANGKFISDTEMSPTNFLWDRETGIGIELLPCDTVGADESGDPICVGDGEPAFYAFSVSVDGTELLGGGFTEFGDFTGEVFDLDAASGDVIGTRILQPDDPGPDIFTDEWAFGYDVSGLGAIDWQTGERLYTGPWAGEIEASPSGDLIALGRDSSDLVILDTASWEEIVTVEGSSRIRGLGFDQRGKRIAVGAVDSMYVVDIESGLIAQQLRLPGVSDIYWLDDETVLVGTSTGILGTLSLSTESFLERTRAALRRSFTAQECATYRIDPCPTLEDIRSGSA